MNNIIWLLENSALSVLESADFKDLFARDSSGSAPSIYSSSSEGVGVIDVVGPLTKNENPFAALFGIRFGTTYSEIVESISAAENDRYVSKIVLNIDSPGGTVDGLFETIAAIESTSKPIEAVVSGTAASAAYALAAATNKITATNRAARFGSIGVVASIRLDKNSVSITSTNAPNKRPDPTTEEGAEVIRAELDGLHDLFVDAIARGRGVDANSVNKNFGRGSVLLADEALARGMIDSVSVSKTSNVKVENKKMDFETLKASHNDLYLKVVAEGVAKERDRISAHLTMGQQSGDMKTAIKAIEDGSDMTQSLMATYMAAAMNAKNVADRLEDEKEVAEAADSSKTIEDDVKVGANILKMAAEKCGVELEV